MSMVCTVVRLEGGDSCCGLRIVNVYHLRSVCFPSSGEQWPAELCVVMRAPGFKLPSGAFSFFFFLSASLSPVNSFQTSLMDHEPRGPFEIYCIRISWCESEHSHFEGPPPPAPAAMSCGYMMKSVLCESRGPELDKPGLQSLLCHLLVRNASSSSEPPLPCL